MTVKILNTGAWLMAAVILLAMIFSLFVSGKYDASNSQVAAWSQTESNMVNYAELVEILDDPAPETLILDLRNEEVFAGRHIPGAISMPLETIQQKKNLRRLKSARSILLYAAHEHEATFAAMLLTGQGISHVRVIPGGFDDMQNLVIREGLDPAYRYFRSEKARYDYPRYLQSNRGPQSAAPGQTPAVPVIKTEVTTVQGGC